MLHWEAALRLDVAAILTYDQRLGRAAQAVGIQVISPRATSHGWAESGDLPGVAPKKLQRVCRDAR